MAVDRKKAATKFAKPQPKIVALGAGKESHGGFDIYPGGRAVWNARVGELPHKTYRDQYSMQTEHTGAISNADRGSREVKKAAGAAETAMALASPAIMGGSLAATIFGRGSRGKLKASRIGAAIGVGLGAAGLAYSAWHKRRQEEMFNRWASQGVIGSDRPSQEQAVMKGFAKELGRRR